jgi:hypothetical protein
MHFGPSSAEGRRIAAMPSHDRFGAPARREGPAIRGKAPGPKRH